VRPTREQAANPSSNPRIYVSRLCGNVRFAAVSGLAIAAIPEDPFQPVFDRGRSPTTCPRIPWPPYRM
jgi:hypothetical protein